MVEVALVLTLATVLIIVGLVGVARWLVPKALAEEPHTEQPQMDHPQQEPDQPGRPT